MMPLVMPRRLAALLTAVGAAVVLSACGSQDIDLDDNASASVKRGAVLFAERCAGCHTMEVVGAQGSAMKIGDQERVDGPNFNTRCESRDDILYAIRNGGFSGAVMPENIVVGDEAEAVADFLTEYAGRQSSSGCAE